MTMPAFAEGLGGRLPSDTERAVANQLRKLLASQAAGEARIDVLDPETKKPVEVVLTPALSSIFLELLRHIGSGDAVTLVPVTQMLTTQQAADILNVSRPFFIGLLERGEIPHETVGRHRRVKAEDLFAYKARRADERAGALSALAEVDGELL